MAGRISSADNAALADMTVTMTDLSVTARTDASGSFLLDHLPGGTHTLQITGRGYVPMQRTITLRDGNTDRVDITMQASTETVDVVEDLREYHVEESSVATRTSARLLDVPQSIQVYPNQLIEDRAILEGNELFRNVSGINQSTYSAMVFRGFTQREILYNGSRGNPFGSLEGDVNGSGFSTSQIRLTNIQRVEVLKGPTSALYGSGEAGGLINYVTKEPAESAYGEVRFRAGSYDQKYAARTSANRSVASCSRAAHFTAKTALLSATTRER